MADIVVGHVVAGDISTGLWCPACALPSGIACDVHILTEHGVMGSVGTYRACVDCGQRLAP